MLNGESLNADDSKQYQSTGGPLALPKRASSNLSVSPIPSRAANLEQVWLGLGGARS